MAVLSLGSPIQLDGGTAFDNYKAQYDLSSPFPCSFSDADSSPTTTQTSSVPSSSFLGYTPPTSDEEGDKDADGEYDATTSSFNASSPAGNSFPSIVSPIPLPGAFHAPFASFEENVATNATSTSSTRLQGTHASAYASQLKNEKSFHASLDSYHHQLLAQASIDTINSTLVAGSYIDVAQSCLSAPGGLIAPLCSSELDKLGYSNDAPRRDSESTSLSFGSYSGSEYSDNAATLAPLSNFTSTQSIAPTPSPTAGVDGYATIGEQQSLNSASDYPGYFPADDECHPCTFSDCHWIAESKDAFTVHQGEHVRAGIFNCPSANCFKHYTVYKNLEAHQLVDHAWSPVVPQTSFTSEVQYEVNPYFSQIDSSTANNNNNTTTTTAQAQFAPTQYEPYYQVAQTANETVGLGFVNAVPLSVQHTDPTATVSMTAPPLMNGAFLNCPPPLPRRASDSNIHTNANGHVSSISWERTMPTLGENEVFTASPQQQQIISRPMSQSGSNCSSAMSTPQQSDRKQRRVAFSVPLPSPPQSSEVMLPQVNETQNQMMMMPSTPPQAPQMNYGPPPMPMDYSRMHNADPHALAARFHAANVAFQDGVHGVPQQMAPQIMASGVYYPNMPNGAPGMVGHPVPQGMEDYFAGQQQYAPAHYMAQHVNLASIDPTMAMSAAYGAQTGDYHAPAYPPTLANHIAHQRLARQALPRRGSESSYLTTHDALHAAAAHPYALALSAALASESKQLIMPDSFGPIRNKPARARINLPGPKGQEIPKASRRGSNSTDLTQGGYVPEEVEGINLAEMKLHPCDFEGCCRVFKRLEHKRRHQRSHTQEKPYQCPVEGCKRFFSRSDNLTQHKRTHERNGRTQRITLANLQHCSGSYSMSSNDNVSFEHMNHIHAA